MIHTQLLDILRHHLTGFLFGACSLNGRAVADITTFYSNRCVIVRGQDESRHRKCGECGAVWSALKGQKQLCAKEIGESRVVVDRINGVFVDKRLADAIRDARVPSIKLFEVPVLLETEELVLEELTVRGRYSR